MAAQAPGWKSPKHAKQWLSTLKAYAFPVVGKLDVRAVALTHVLEILQPIWSTKVKKRKKRHHAALSKTPVNTFWFYRSVITKSKLSEASGSMRLPLQTAFLNETIPDRRDVCLSIAQRVCRRVDRVLAEDEIVFVRRGRA